MQYAYLSPCSNHCQGDVLPPGTEIWGMALSRCSAHGWEVAEDTENMQLLVI
jgi:hypothetical protein